MAVAEDYGKIDILVHSLPNGTEVTKPHLEMSHTGYLVASLASAYLVVSLLNKFVLIMNKGRHAVRHLHRLRLGYPRVRRRHI